MINGPPTNHHRLGVVVVYFEPDTDIARRQLAALAGQDLSLVVVDNSAKPHGAVLQGQTDYFSRIDYLFLNGNKGIAEAQNIGIERLQGLADYVVLLDQDSIPEKEMLSSLLSELLQLANSGYRIAAIGPTPINRATGQPYRARLRQDKNIFPGSNTAQVGQLIASGMLFSMQTYSEIGGMENGLFIDGVDHEWCWRARSVFHYEIAMSRTAKLSHMLGEGDRKLLLFSLKISTPFRLYYQIRNYILLSTRPYVPFKWKISNFFKYFVKFFYYTTIPSQRRLYAKNFVRGARDGICVALKRRLIEGSNR